jgi:hypothetical protein
MFWSICGLIFIGVAVYGMATGEIDFDDRCVCGEGRSYECSECGDRIKAES